MAKHCWKDAWLGAGDLSGWKCSKCGRELVEWEGSEWYSECLFDINNMILTTDQLIECIHVIEEYYLIGLTIDQMALVLI